MQRQQDLMVFNSNFGSFDVENDNEETVGCSDCHKTFDKVDDAIKHDCSPLPQTLPILACA